MIQHCFILVVWPAPLPAAPQGRHSGVTWCPSSVNCADLFPTACPVAESTDCVTATEPRSQRPASDLDPDLVRRAQAGDTDAFGELVQRNRRAVFRAALAALGSTADADDVAQEAFVTAYRKLGSFRGDAAFRTWLLAITWRKALDRRKSVARWLRLTVTPTDSDADAANWIEQMPADQRTQEEDARRRAVAADAQAADQDAAAQAARRAAARRLGRIQLRADRPHARDPGRHREMASLGSAARSEGKNGSAGTRV